jgi:hypothetical protein
MKVLFKDPHGQLLGDKTELYHTMMSPAWNQYVDKYSDGIVSFKLYIAGGVTLDFM